MDELIPFYCADPKRGTEAEDIAQRNAFKWLNTLPDDLPWALVLTAHRLELQQFGKKAPGPIYVDFVGGKAAHRRQFGGGRGQPLARAVGLKGGKSPSVIDATAGMGRDAFVLASLGCKVTLLERSPVVAELLRDGLQRGLADFAVAEIAQRMTLVTGDAINKLQSIVPHEVVYLDPMYPHRDKSASVKKEMLLFRALVGDDPDTDRLLDAATKAAIKRVVVKRPKGAEPLGKQKPNGEIPGKTTRYDLYL